MSYLIKLLVDCLLPVGVNDIVSDKSQVNLSHSRGLNRHRKSHYALFKSEDIRNKLRLTKSDSDSEWPKVVLKRKSTINSLSTKPYFLWIISFGFRQRQDENNYFINYAFHTMHVDNLHENTNLKGTSLLLQYVHKPTFICGSFEK